MHAQWDPPPATFRLGDAELHVWRAAINVDAVTVERLAHLLSPDERERAARFVFAVDRKRFIVARGTLRWLLGAYLDVPPPALRFDYTAYGKPSLASPQGGPQLCFNLSHSGELALIALAWERRVGVDVERVCQELHYTTLLPGIFSAREQLALAALPEERRRRAFYDSWTRKEAYLKARGEGLSYPPDRVELSLGPGDSATLHLPPEALSGGPWLLYALDPGAGYAAAVAAEGSLARLCRFTAP